MTKARVPQTGGGHADPRECRFLVVSLASLLLLVYARVVFGGQTFAVDGDHLRFVIPARAQLAEALWNGRVPEWWDGVELGVNVAGTPYYQSAYPPAWLVALLGAAYGADVILLAHLFVGALGLSLWARRLGASCYGALIGGTLLMLGGYMSSMVVLHTAAMSAGWIPWVAWSADRVAVAASGDDRRSLLVAAAIAAMPMSMLLMSGDPSAAVSGAIVGLLVAAARGHKRLRATAIEAGAVSVAVAMSAAVLLPAALYLPETDRSSWGDNPNVWLAWSLHPLSLFQLVWPRALGDPVEPTANLARIVADAAQTTGGASAWASSIHFGWVAIGLVACGTFAPIRGVRVLAVGSLLLLLVAMGQYTPFYAWFRALVVPERWLRYPARHFAAVVVLWSALAAVGLDEALRHARRKTIWLTVLLSLLVSLSMTILARIWGATLLSPLLQNGPTVRPVEATRVAGAIFTGGVSTVATLIGFGGGILAATRERMRRWAGPLVAATLALDLGLEATAFIPLVSRDAVTRDAGILMGLSPNRRPDAPRPRLYRDPSYSWSGPPPGPESVAILMGRTAAEDLGCLHGFAYVPGYAPAVTGARWNRVLEASHTDGSISKLMELFNIDYAVFVDRDQDTRTARVSAPSGFELTSRDEADLLTILRKTHVRPRAFVTSHWVSLDNDDAVVASMFASSFDHGLVRFVNDSTQREEQGDSTASARCDVSSPRPESVDLQCSLPTEGYAVLVDSWSPGWSATVDGKPVSVERADEVLRAVRVEHGSHDISFHFAAPGLRAGAWISILTWLGVGLIAMMASRLRAGGPLPVSGRRAENELGQGVVFRQCHLTKEEEAMKCLRSPEGGPTTRALDLSPSQIRVSGKRQIQATQYRTERPTRNWRRGRQEEAAYLFARGSIGRFIALADTRITPLPSAVTCTGLNRLVVVPSPTCPSALFPQHHRVPSIFTAHA